GGDHAPRSADLSADDLYVAAQIFDVRADARDQSAATHRNEDRMQRRTVLIEYLHADGALPGDHVRVVKRMDENVAVLRHQVVRVIARFVEVVAVQDHARAEIAHRRYL